MLGRTGIDDSYLLSFEINTRFWVFEKFQNQRATGSGYLKKKSESKNHWNQKIPHSFLCHDLTLKTWEPWSYMIINFISGLAYQGKDIVVFRFIIESSSLRDFSPIGLFYMRKMIFWLVLKLEINYRVIISWRLLVCF